MNELLDFLVSNTGPKGSFTIGYNDHHGDNETIQEYSQNHSQWVSEDDFKKACESDTMWTLQWYPQTAVGFYLVYASGLDTLSHFVVREFKKGVDI